MILNEFDHLALLQYKNKQCSTLDEFFEDLIRIKVIRKAITQYESGVVINHRLILNHIVILYNVFDGFATEILLKRIPKSQWCILFCFLDTIDRLPEYLVDYSMYSSDIARAEELQKTLREL
jgi:hypothetical protein